MKNETRKPQDVESVDSNALLAEENTKLKEALHGLLCWCPSADVVGFTTRRRYVEAKTKARVALNNANNPRLTKN